MVKLGQQCMERVASIVNERLGKCNQRHFSVFYQHWHEIKCMLIFFCSKKEKKENFEIWIRGWRGDGGSVKTTFWYSSLKCMEQNMNMLLLVIEFRKEKSPSWKGFSLNWYLNRHGNYKSCVHFSLCIVNRKFFLLTLTEKAPRSSSGIQTPTSLPLSSGPGPPLLRSQSTTTPTVTPTTPLARETTPGRPSSTSDMMISSPKSMPSDSLSLSSSFTR